MVRLDFRFAADRRKDQWQQTARHRASTVAPDNKPLGATVEGVCVAAADKAAAATQGSTLWLWQGVHSVIRTIFGKVSLDVFVQ